MTIRGVKKFSGDTGEVGIYSFMIPINKLKRSIKLMHHALFIWIECWKYEPNECPNMKKIVSTLKARMIILRNLIFSKKYRICII